MRGRSKGFDYLLANFLIFLFQVCKQLDVTPLRSAYQIRYAGFKGMLSVDPTLDNDPSGKKVMLRKSMHKFESDTSHTLEIVKYSQPSKYF